MMRRKHLAYIQDYMRRIGSSDMVALAEATEDRLYGMGVVYAATDVDALVERLAEYPDTWVIAQWRDELLATLEASDET